MLRVRVPRSRPYLSLTFLIPLGFSVVMLLLFVPLYRYEQRDFAKVVE